MIIRRIVLALALSTLPLFSYADINIQNHTDYHGTARIGSSSCSADVGLRGILQPQGPLTVPDYAIFFFCGLLQCDAYLYASQDCSGKEVAKLTIQYGKGITGIEKRDERFAFSGGGGNLEINPGKTRWLEKLFRFMS